MLMIKFVNIRAAQKYVAGATSALQSFPNSYIMMGRERIGRHTYIKVADRQTKRQTRIYAGHIERHWSGR